jgi:[acyl-carrier-protein] S-malonyltransferase
VSGQSAVVFAGQGAQFVGMGRDLAEAYPECGLLFEKADSVLGYGLSKLCFEGPEQELARSDHCQPAIFVTSMACYGALRVEAGEPGFAAAAGLSLGEWSALHAAGALSFEAALRLLEARGRFMQEACEMQEGGMVSIIGLTPDRLREICGEADVEIANLNSAQQTVLSGPRESIERAAGLAREAGAKLAVMLKVAGAYHSRLMSSAGERLAEVLAGTELDDLSMPVMANVTGREHGSAGDIRDLMVRQVTSPVRWQECVEGMLGRGITRFVECGPGKVLSGLIKRIDRTAEVYNVQDVDTLKSAASALFAGQ